MPSLYVDWNQDKVDSVRSDDEKDDVMFEKWKARENNRLRRNQEEKEA
jgi:hypothetical protein